MKRKDLAKIYQTIINKINTGSSYEDIYEEFGYSKTRIMMYCTANNLLVAPEGSLAHRRHLFPLDAHLFSSASLKYISKKNDAKQKGIEFSIKFEEIPWVKTCPILGIELDYMCQGRQENSVSFDRIDNTKGYIINNVCVLSWRANRIKNDGTEDEHRRIAEFLHNIRKSENKT